MLKSVGRTILRMPHTDGGETSNIIFNSRPRPSNTENKIVSVYYTYSSGLTEACSSGLAIGIVHKVKPLL